MIYFWNFNISWCNFTIFLKITQLYVFFTISLGFVENIYSFYCKNTGCFAIFGKKLSFTRTDFFGNVGVNREERSGRCTFSSQRRRPFWDRRRDNFLVKVSKKLVTVLFVLNTPPVIFLAPNQGEGGVYLRRFSKNRL